MSFIEIVEIDKFYGVMQALHKINLKIPRGSFLTLLGPSGSGKTTLLKLLAGFEDASSGKILLEGRDITALKPEKRNFGLVFQGYALFPHMTVFDNVAYPLKVRRRGREEIAERVRTMLELVQLGRFAHRKPHELSGGQQQRVALARALVFEPDLLLLDEPMSALDKKLRVDLQEQLRDIHSRLGTTFINVTHDQEEAMHMSDVIAVMNQGRIEQHGTPSDLYHRPKSRFTADFIGKSNIFEGELRNGSFRTSAFEVPSARLEGAVRDSGAASLVLRPEDICVLTPDTVEPREAVRLRASVETATYSGDRALYSLRLPDSTSLLAYGTARGGTLPRGTELTLAFRPEDAILLA